MALPLGIVQTRQITKAAWANIPTTGPMASDAYRDVAMFNAVVVDETIPDFGNSFDMDALLHSETLLLQANYLSPASVLQKTGLHIEQFASNHILGRIAPDRAGILVFSIPFNAGWVLKIDGKETPMFRANFGMLAATVVAGQHSVELNFHIPGRNLGLGFSAMGLGLLGIAALLKRYLTRLKKDAVTN